MLKWHYVFGVVAICSGPLLASDDIATNHPNRPPWPSVQKSPPLSELRNISKRLTSIRKTIVPPNSGFFYEDWKTQGNWFGHYGTESAILCATSAPSDDVAAYSKKPYSVWDFIGPHRASDDALRHWIHWLKTENPKTLYVPQLGYRRQAEWDDHGEAYPMSHDGPDLWFLLELESEGIYSLSLYFFNKDGHTGHNRHRDYLIEIYPAPAEQQDIKDIFEEWPRLSEIAHRTSQNTAPLAKTRLRDFWGGAYKVFCIAGPSKYFVRIKRNYSFNTILSLVAIDCLKGESMTERMGIPLMHRYSYAAPRVTHLSLSEKALTVLEAWKSLDDSYDKVDCIKYQRKARIGACCLAKELSVEDPPQDLNSLKYIEWHLKQWNDEQRLNWNRMADETCRLHLKANPHLLSEQDSSNETPKNKPSK